MDNPGLPSYSCMRYFSIENNPGGAFAMTSSSQGLRLNAHFMFQTVDQPDQTQRACQLTIVVIYLT